MRREEGGGVGSGLGRALESAGACTVRKGKKKKKHPKDSLQCSFTYRLVGATGMLLDHKSTSG